MNEADTCRTYVLPKLKSAGWEDEYISEQMVFAPECIVTIDDRHTRVQTRLALLPNVRSTKGEELSALLPSVLDKAFKGEL
jgi:hypothetical protein